MRRLNLKSHSKISTIAGVLLREIRNFAVGTRLFALPGPPFGKVCEIPFHVARGWYMANLAISLRELR